MVLIPTVDRNKRQDSPMLWLSLLAGSLALHLVLLLIGRWYFSQPQGSPISNATPIEIEVAPNAPNRAASTPVAPTSSVAEAAPPKSAPQAPSTDSETAIQSLSRNPVPARQAERSASPPSKPDQRTTSRNGQEPINPPDSGQRSGQGSGKDSTGAGDRTTPGSPSTNSGRPTSPSSPSSNSQLSKGPQTTPDQGPSTPATSDQALGGNREFKTQIIGQLVSTNGGLQTSGKSATLKGEIPPIALELAASLDKPIKGKVILIINNDDGTVADVILPDNANSQNPDKRPDPTSAAQMQDLETLKAIAYATLLRPGVVFDVKVEAEPGKPPAPQSSWETTLQIQALKK